MQTISPKVELVVDAKDTVGETPVWRPEEQALYWIDCDGPPELQRWDSATGEVRRWTMPERIGGFVFKQSGGALVTLASGIYDLDFATGGLSLRARSPLPDHVALHECACDPSGRFWVGAIDHRIGPGNMHPDGAKLFRLEGNELVCAVDGISCANGLAFSPAGDALYLSDSTTQRCDRYPLDLAKGELGEPDTFFQLELNDGFVDGAATDNEGGYWATLVYAGRLRRYLPDGTLDIEVPLPFDNPTKVAFGGPDMRRLFITSTSQGLGEAKPSDVDGGLFAFDCDFAGRPDPRFG
jgi:L-arabinonolactonase